MLEKVISAAYACQPCDDDEYYDCVDDYDDGGNDYDDNNGGDENDNAGRNNLGNKFTNDVNVNTGSDVRGNDTMNLSCDGCRNETCSSSDENNSDPEIIDVVPPSVARNSSRISIRCDESREFQRSMDSVTLETVLASLIVRISNIFVTFNSYRSIIQLLLSSSVSCKL